MLLHALSQVRQTWRTYEGKDATRKVKRQLADKGRAYIIACLRALGKARWTVLLTCKERPALPICTARIGRDGGALTVQGYLEYAGAADDDSDDERTPPRDMKTAAPNGAGERDARGEDKERMGRGTRVLSLTIRGGGRHAPWAARALLCQGSEGIRGGRRAGMHRRSRCGHAAARRALTSVQALRQAGARGA
eukprot:6177547-Pleurochrysis_carterae.AAC.4